MIFGKCKLSLMVDGRIACESSECLASSTSSGTYESRLEAELLERKAFPKQSFTKRKSKVKRSHQGEQFRSHREQFL